MARRNFIPWRYTSQDGRTYVRRADAAIVGQNNTATPPAPKVGGANPSTDSPYPVEFPRSWRARGARVSDATGFSSFVVCYTATCDLFATAGTTISLVDATGVAHVCTVDVLLEERLGRRKRKETGP